MNEFAPELARFIKDHQLPDDYAGQAMTFFLPLADRLLETMQQSKKETLVAGVYGAQGSGKSTLADLLLRYISASGKTVVGLSLDDFYLTREERAQLAAEVSPLLATRGPPGTHDVELALSSVQQATTLAAGASMAIPRFDKASDDRVVESQFDKVRGPVDLVILEGWCLGCEPVPDDQLIEPINELERDKDPDGTWRRFVNESIASYQPLFDSIDELVMLKTSNFESVLRWRTVQEDKLRSATRSPGSSIMTSAELEQFVQYFERVSRNTEAQVERIADVVFTQDDNHRVTGIRRNK